MITMLERRSTLTGRVHTMEIPMEHNAFVDAFRAWENGTLIQDAFPTLSVDLREFIMTGITSEEWDSLFGSLPTEEE